MPQPITAKATLPVALPLRGKCVLVLGGGHEADEKTRTLLALGAHVTLVASTVSSELARAARHKQIVWFARDFVPSDVRGAHLVMLTDQDEARARELSALRRGEGFWLCAIDQPAFSDVYLVSIVSSGPVQIGISTGGLAPLLARKLRTALERAFDQRFEQFAHNFARLRSSLRQLPKPERTQALERALNGFAMEVRLSYPAEGDCVGGDVSQER